MTAVGELTIIRTEDMALVTVLKMRGISHEKMERVGKGGARWVFQRTDTIMEVVDEYLADEAFVEPREFVRCLAGVRSELYEFLGRKRTQR